MPLSLAPAWLRRLAALNPLSHIVSATRSLFNGWPADPGVVSGVVISVALAGVAVALSARVFGRTAA